LGRDGKQDDGWPRCVINHYAIAWSKIKVRPRHGNVADHRCTVVVRNADELDLS
jgi:hypothetical protein